MSKLSADRYQVWFPGKLAWELWLINQKRGKAKLVETATSSHELKFKAGGGFRVLALPASEVLATTFYSSAINETRLLRGASIFLNQQRNMDCDFDGIGVQPIAGYPPKTLTRIDGPLEKVAASYPDKLAPDLIVPSASLLPIGRRGIALWNEFGKPVVAFEKNGMTAWYTSSSQEIDADQSEFFETFLSKAESLSEERTIDKIASVQVWCKLPKTSFGSLDDDAEIFRSDRPAPSNLRSTIGMKPLEIREVENEFSQKRQRVRTAMLAAVATLILVAVSVGIFFFADQQTESQRQEIAELSEKIKRVQEAQSIWNEVAPAVDRNQSILETWRKIITTPGARYISVNRFAIAAQGIAIHCQANTRGDAMRFIDAVSQNDRLSEYFWEYSTPKVRADGTALFELKGYPTSNL